MRTVNAPRNASDSLWICYFAGPHEGKGPVQVYAGSTHDAENICYRLMKVPHHYTLAVRAPRRSASDRGRRRASRDDYRAKRGTYGGMCLCPCEGSKHPPTMATFDPEDPYYAGDRTRRRKKRRSARSCGWGPKLSGISRSSRRR